MPTTTDSNTATNSATPEEPEGGRSTGSETDHDQSTSPARHVRFWKALGSIGPFALSLTVYGILLDHLQDGWFKYGILRFVFAGACALVVGMGVRLLIEAPIRRSATPRLYTGSVVELAGNEERMCASAHSLLNHTAKRVVADFRQCRRDENLLTGWSQYMGENVLPTAIGTSYGLRTVLALDVREPRINREEVVQTLLRLQREGGGWAASTQRGIARPEVTAWVAGAVCRAGVDAKTRGEIVARLEQLANAPDPGAGNRTTVLTVLVSTLAEIAPGSSLLPKLANNLAGGAEVNRERMMASWGETVDGIHKRSVPYTARAVVALDRAAKVLGDGFDHSDTVAAGIEWLSREDLDLGARDEQIRRRMPTGDVDALFVGHFTAAWVVRALMRDEDQVRRASQIKTALEAVLRSQEDGVWTWHDGSRPTWMTYQGVMAVRELALRSMKWIP